MYGSEPVVRAVIDRCDEVFASETGGSLLDGMLGGGDSSVRFAEHSWTQAATYAIECAMGGLWESVGVTPNVVLGHGIGGNRLGPDSRGDQSGRWIKDCGATRPVIAEDIE